MKHWSVAPPLVLLTVLLAFCFSPVLKGEIDKLIWETSGGGSIKFTVVREGHDYRVHLESHRFSEQDVDLVLTSNDGKAYEVVEAIFTKRLNLQDDTFTPEGATGTWTSITLVSVDGNEQKFDNISTQGDLRELYHFVAAATKKDEPGSADDS